ncbi:protein-ADP-ribose hydrolase [Eubacteriales bacterium OttesenSCG-928-A19]|nr:protein-ADP-ribose hydrolase [Eubacteriales bacterium OttesenSCG-928-A19]
MTQEERLDYLIGALLEERPRTRLDARMPSELQLRSLLNMRPPMPVSGTFLQVQDAYLRQAIRERGVTDITALKPVREGIYLWRGDITTLRAGAIVNAANSRMLGCFVPCHTCIDNAIHTYAGVQLRLACQALTEGQARPQATGAARITAGYNLPSDHVIHTVGPIVFGRLTRQDCDLLAACYRACLTLAERHGIESIAFCCISTGEYRFPNQAAAEIALDTVTRYRTEEKSKIKVIFNVFKEYDDEIYRRLLGAD